MTTRNILVAIPNHTNSLKGEMHDALVTAAIEATKAGWGFETQRLMGGYHHLARNTLLGFFHARKEFTDLVWWDDDVAIQKGAFVPFVEHDVDFVCAPYRHKRDEESYPGQLKAPGELRIHESASTKTPLFNALYWVIGLSRQTRTCVDRILSDPSIEWDDDDISGDKTPYVFTEERIGKRKDGGKSLLTEDYIYCRRWIDAGGDVWVDPMMLTGHSGNQCWWGRYGTVMQRAVEENMTRQALKFVDDLSLHELGEFAEHRR